MLREDFSYFKKRDIWGPDGKVPEYLLKPGVSRAIGLSSYYNTLTMGSGARRHQDPGMCTVVE